MSESHYSVRTTSFIDCPYDVVIVTDGVSCSIGMARYEMWDDAAVKATDLNLIKSGKKE